MLSVAGFAGTPRTAGYTSPLTQKVPAATVIDGSVSPERISDYLAYSTLFRIASNRSGVETRAIRGYLRQIGMARPCVSCPGTGTNEDSQIDTLLSAAAEFHDRVHVLDIRLGQLVRQHRDPKDAELSRLRQEKEAICAEIVASLKWRLGPTDAQKVHEHVDRMKDTMSVVLDPR